MSSIESVESLESVLAVAGAPDLGEARAARADELVKRGFDVVVSSILLVLLLPLIVLLAVVIRLESRGPVLYRCRRVGQHGRELSMLKFRKMRDDAQGPSLTLSGDDRFTRIGQFLALTKLDEIPQLWNVVRGDMSLVGPRPETEEFVARHPEAFARILRVRPGITGLSQLAYAREGRILDPEDRVADYLRRVLPQKMGLDQLYSAGRTVWSDLQILMWTGVAVLLRQEVAVHRATGRLSRRRRRAAQGTVSTHVNRAL